MEINTAEGALSVWVLWLDHLQCTKTQPGSREGAGRTSGL